MRVVWTDPFLRASTAMIGLSNVVIQVVLLLILLELKNSDHPPWTVGLVLGMAGVGGIAGAALATWLIARIPSQLGYRRALWAWTAAGADRVQRQSLCACRVLGWGRLRGRCQ
ncbi:hypothetical protein [Nocardia sp. KC 131]|uniref:hypothetical protein n=1 Tax=Nocardia arseniciresistens TaxID=3392119 RepID=UPI00398EF7C4